MSRTWKKFQSKCEDDSDSDSDVYEDDAHNRFLENIKQSEDKPKITPGTREEPAAEVSEFNLQSKRKTDKAKSIFRKNDLLRPLKSKNAKLAQSLEAVKKTLALSKPQVEVYDHTENFLFCSSFNPSLLEKELSAVLNSSDVAKEDHEKMKQTKFRATLKDILSKRQAKASYIASKAREQNKIKSKKYHRLLRGESTKEQIKDCKARPETDLEAALDQLDMLDMEREDWETRDKYPLVKEITNSSGCWTVSKLPTSETVTQPENDEDEAFRIMVEDAIAIDDVLVDLEKEKARAVDDSLPKIDESSSTGLGSWTSSTELTDNETTTKTKRPRFNKRLLFKAPKALPRKDSNKGHVIMNEEKSNKLKEQLVSQVKDSEGSIRASVGHNWEPETAHQQLIAPSDVTKLGAVIDDDTLDSS